MAITYSWEIKKIETTKIADTENVVTNIEYYKIGTDDQDGVSGRYAGMCTYDPEKISPNETFIPFEDLTEQQILSWIQQKISADITLETNINTIIESSINRNRNRSQLSTKMPWRN